jgi:hypothetical protein
METKNEVRSLRGAQNGMGWDGMGWDGMGWDGMGWCGLGVFGWGLGWLGLGGDGIGTKQAQCRGFGSGRRSLTSKMIYSAGKAK